MITVIAVVATLVISVLISVTATNTYHKKVADQKIGSAEERARKIILYKRKTEKAVLYKILYNEN